MFQKEKKQSSPVFPTFRLKTVKSPVRTVNFPDISLSTLPFQVVKSAAVGRRRPPLINRKLRPEDEMKPTQSSALNTNLGILSPIARAYQSGELNGEFRSDGNSRALSNLPGEREWSWRGADWARFIITMYSIRRLFIFPMIDAP